MNGRLVFNYVVLNLFSKDLGGNFINNIKKRTENKIHSVFIYNVIRY